MKTNPIVCWTRTDTAENAQCCAWAVEWASELREEADVFPADLDPKKAKLYKVTISAVEAKPKKRAKKELVEKLTPKKFHLRVLGVECPSEIIAEEMRARGWTYSTLAQNMRYTSAERVEDYALVAHRQPRATMGDELAGDLDRAFGTCKGFWLRLEQLWLDNIVEE
jgi:plasmid maintenance system antidote protein VapI